MSAPERDDTWPEGFVSGNVFDKYRTKNPLYRRLMQRFLADCNELLNDAQPDFIVEIGCGPGDLVQELDPRAEIPYLGTDLSLHEVLDARSQGSGRRFLPASADRLPFPDRSVDTVLACEVLEHLDDPAATLREAARICRHHCLVSVPWEPVWRFLNVARGRYWSALGNTPGHLQHFSRKSIRALVAEHFEIVAERRPFPWTVLLARSRALD